MNSTFLSTILGSQFLGGGGGGGGGAVATCFMASANVEGPNATTHFTSGASTSFNDATFFVPTATTIRGAGFSVTRVAGLRADFSCGVEIDGVYTELFNKLAGYTGQEHQTGLSIAVPAGSWVQMKYTSGNNFSLGVGMTLFFQDATDTGGLWQQRMLARNVNATPITMSAGEKNYGQYIVPPVDVRVTAIGMKVETAPDTLPCDLSLQILRTGETDPVEVAFGAVEVGNDSVIVTGLDIDVLAGEGIVLTATDGAARGINVIGTVEMFIPQSVDGTNQWTYLTDQSEYRVAPFTFDYHSMMMLSDTNLIHVSSTVESSAGTDLVYSLNGGADTTLIALPGPAGEVESAVTVAMSRGDDVAFGSTGGGGTGSGISFAGIFNTDFEAAGPPAATPPTPHRYWRILCTEGDNSSFFSFSELEFRTRTRGPDVTESANYLEGAHYSTKVGSRAFDGSYFTNEWTVERSEDPADQWIGNDLQTAYDITEIEASSRDGGNADHTPREFDVQWSDDAVTWTTKWSVVTDAWGASETRVFEAPAVVIDPFDGKEVVFLLAGQSNMIGRFGPIDPVLDATDPDILMYDADGDALVTAADPLDHFGENPAQIGLGLTFAKDFKTAKNPSKVILVGGGLGGAGFLNGDWVELNDNHYADVRARWVAAWTEVLLTYPDAVLGGVLWLQGEDEVIDFDSTMTNGYDYTAMSMNLLRNIRTDFPGFVASTPVVVGALPPGTALTGQTSYAGIQTAISEVPTVLNHAGFAAGVDLTLGDDRHYDAVALRTLGSRFAVAHENAVNSAVAAIVPAFTPDASNVSTEFAFNVAGQADYTPLTFAAGTNTRMENKRVYVENGYMQFDGDAELRLGGFAGDQILLSDRDFLIKTKIKFDSTAGAKGIFSTYQTTDNKRSYVLRMNAGTLQFYMSSDGVGATLMLSHAMSSATDYEIEVRRVGTALTLRVDDVEVDTYTLTSGYTAFDPADSTMKTLIGDHINANNLLGQIENISFEFLS